MKPNPIEDDPFQGVVPKTASEMTPAERLAADEYRRRKTSMSKTPTNFSKRLAIGSWVSGIGTLSSSSGTRSHHAKDDSAQGKVGADMQLSRDGWFCMRIGDHGITSLRTYVEFASLQAKGADSSYASITTSSCKTCSISHHANAQSSEEVIAGRL